MRESENFYSVEQFRCPTLFNYFKYRKISKQIQKHYFKK